MAEDFTSEGLLTKIANYTLDPITATSEPFNKVQTLSVADDVIRTRVVPFIQALREDYYLTYADTALTTDVLAYDLPTNAIASKVRLVTVLDSAGNESEPLVFTPLGSQHSPDYRGNSVCTFHFRGDKIHLKPYPTGQTTLRVYYYERPKMLVDSSNYCTIATLVDGDQLTLDTATPPDFVVSGATVSIQSNTFPFAEIDAPVFQTVAGAAVTTSANYDDDVEAGMYVVEPGTTAFPNIPSDCFPWLARLVAVELLQARGDITAAQAQGQAAAVEEAYLRVLYTPRADGHPKKVTSPYNISRLARRY